MEERRVTPHPCHASHLAVASTDPLSFVVSLMLVVIVLGGLVIFIDSRITGFEPKESWAEVSAGVLLITLGILAVVHYRTRSINRILGSAHWRKARLEKFRTASQWTILRVAYEMNGNMTEKGVWLANSRRSRALGKLDEITLAFDPASPRRFVITNLYC